MILGLLRQRPMHGYDLSNSLQLSQADKWAGILPGSIYYALKKMADEGLVRLRANEQIGNRNKAIYEITPEGEQEFLRLLREALSTVSLHFPRHLYTSLIFLTCLPRAEVLSALSEQINGLEKELADMNLGETVKSTGMNDLIKAAFDNAREHIALDLKFLHQIYNLYAKTDSQVYATEREE